MGKSQLAACAVAVLLAGCGDSKKEPEEVASAPVNVVQAGAPGEPSQKVAPGATPAPVLHTPADVEFMQGMIHHHQQAIVMTDWVPERTENTSVRVMARRMAISQTERDGHDAQVAQGPRRRSHRPLARPQADARDAELTSARAAQDRRGRHVRPALPALHDPAPRGRADDGQGPARHGRRRARPRSASSCATWMPIRRSRSAACSSCSASSRGLSARGRPGSPGRRPGPAGPGRSSRRRARSTR